MTVFIRGMFTKSGVEKVEKLVLVSVVYPLSLNDAATLRNSGDGSITG